MAEERGGGFGHIGRELGRALVEGEGGIGPSEWWSRNLSGEEGK